MKANFSLPSPTLTALEERAIWYSTYHFFGLLLDNPIQSKLLHSHFVQHADCDGRNKSKHTQQSTCKKNVLQDFPVVERTE